jgi:hypothetical protein
MIGVLPLRWLLLAAICIILLWICTYFGNIGSLSSHYVAQPSVREVDKRSAKQKGGGVGTDASLKAEIGTARPKESGKTSSGDERIAAGGDIYVFEVFLDTQLDAAPPRGFSMSVDLYADSTLVANGVVGRGETAERFDQLRRVLPLRTIAAASKGQHGRLEVTVRNIDPDEWTGSFQIRFKESADTWKEVLSTKPVELTQDRRLVFDFTW